ncbi:(p)ppGpp synthetase [Thermoclostridium stercorarium subsp. leptospartum DSM 9219]|uniref:GTP diphosphokinase n=1 Tax=Thermoclostridium stercorarium subsp. leptospartum DSM 9219 TaxID=1346611 RepID=A0A1B1YPE4_THEST|nr:bifunctional (p)ppGpp synthetase/guanosine-3',5'-bis(diphosphate) 3'-pyrophosphohydrolase [Thermoclostridium stercorarium]ANX02659.1 (p)ppGpp synthetase [Thermoclostridium stercorarium subsp. leptospartum DSM 9219]
MLEEYNRLIEKLKSNGKEYNWGLIEKAYKFACIAHEGQKRSSGEPFVIHPLQVAYILAEMEMDTATVVAGMLHDTVEDSSFTYENTLKNFGEEIANLVDGVTKLAKIPYTNKQEIQAENLRKMFLAMSKDIRVIIIKLADRLHNMRTLKYKPREKQIEIAQETLDIYAPLAHRLGIYKVKWELEDLSFRYLHEKEYYDLAEKIAKKRKEREEYIENIMKTVAEKAMEMGIEAHIDGRPKHLYSIYMKMKRQHKELDQIYDLFAIRVIVNTVKDCYAVLGLVHELYKPMPGRFKDYISMPKPNMYQSLHTTVIGPEGIPFEVQIRTWEMHRIAEVGIAAHWKYKEGGRQNDDLSEKLAWLRQLLDWQKETTDPDEFMENLKIDLFTDEVFVFTPKGDVKCLKAGSTPIDFAYAIHSDIGNRMIGAKVNGRIESLDYELKNGDIVEIITSATSKGPSRDWLKKVKTSQARNKINQWFKKEKRDENIARGRELFEKELKKQGLSSQQILKPEIFAAAFKKYNYHDMDDLYLAIGLDAISSGKAVSRLKEEYRKTLPPEEQKQLLEEEKKKELSKKQKERPAPETGVIVKGIENCLVRLSRCCNPVPGDEIVGYITRGRGVSVHRKDCINIQSNLNDNERLIEVEWYKGKAASYQAELAVKAYDRTHLLLEITNVISDAGVPLKAINARTTRDNVAVMNLTVEITDTEQLEKIINRIRRVPDVFEITRNNK